MPFPRTFLAAVTLVAGFIACFSLWATPAQALNEVYISGQRCNNKQGGGPEFSKDWYVYFETDSSRVRAQDLPKIKHIYGIAKGQSAQQICLIGKASKVGDPSGNNALGEKRARNVADAFAKLGWPRSKMAIGTEGEAWGWLNDILTSDAKADRRVLIRLSQ